MAGAFSAEELDRLDDLGHRREAVARMDICQMHLTEFGAAENYTSGGTVSTDG